MGPISASEQGADFRAFLQLEASEERSQHELGSASSGLGPGFNENYVRDVCDNAAIVTHTKVIASIISATLLWLIVPVFAATNPPLDQSYSGPYASWKNVKTYGAVGDGVHDDTAPIQAALNDLKNVATNKWSVLYFPAGTYRITAQLTTLRVAHQDYLGAELVGEDPNTTIIKWDGVVGANMLKWDAWYDKVSRFTFDGSGKANWAIVRAPHFSTYSEMTDLNLHDFSGGCINLGNGEGGGMADLIIARSRFVRCGVGITSWDYNTLDVDVWHNYFEDNRYGLTAPSGAFGIYDNRFVRSSLADITGGSGQYTIVNNVSNGSQSFISQLQVSAHVQGNKIYNTTGLAMDLTMADATLIDNLIQSMYSPMLVKMRSGKDLNRTLAVGNTFATANPWPMQPAWVTFNHGDGGSWFTGHPIQSAVDGDAATYAALGIFGDVGIQWNAPAGTQKIITTYAITSSPYFSDRTPSEWVLLGSNDFGQHWATLDSRSAQTFTAAAQRKVFTIASPEAYSDYQLVIKKTADGLNGTVGYYPTIAEFELIDSTGTNLARDPQSLVIGANEYWGGLFIDEQSVVPPSSVQAPASLQPFDYAPKRIAQVIEVSAFTSGAIQTAIDQGAALPAGSNPVVHLRKGLYRITNTVTVPPNVPMTIIGDGANENGTVLQWYGQRPGLTMWLKGPSRAVLDDLSVNGIGPASGGDGLLIDNANQPGGRIYGYEVIGSGQSANKGFVVDAAFDIIGLDQTHVDISEGQVTNFGSGIRVTGGPGHIQFLTGSTAGGQRMFYVRNNASLVSTQWWYEQDWRYTAAIIDLSSTSSGNIALAAIQYAAKNPYGLVRLDNFPGTLTILNGAFNSTGAPPLSFTGDGSKTNVLITQAIGANRGITPITVNDTTNPAGSISMMYSGTDNTTVTNKVLDALPTKTFIKDQLALLRTIETQYAVAMSPGVTDVKLIRVSASGGNGRFAFKFVGTPRGVVPTR